jgi:hypothetical protein
VTARIWEHSRFNGFPAWLRLRQKETVETNGGAVQTVTGSTSDYWDFSIADNVVSSLGGNQDVFVYWQEPDSGVNLVRFQQVGGNGTEITVTRDTTQSQGYPAFGNGVTMSFNTDINPGISGGNRAAFTDNGDNVPDGGMTVGLLGMALLGMSVIRRKLAKQGNRRFPILVFKKQVRGFRRGLVHFQR